MAHYGCYIFEYLIVREALNKGDVLFVSILTHDPSNVAAVDCMDQRVLACVHAPARMQVATEWGCFDPATDHIVAGAMTTLIEWLPEYFNEGTLPHQIMKNSCYNSVLVRTASKDFIYCLIFLLASSAGAIV